MLLCFMNAPEPPQTVEPTSQKGDRQSTYIYIERAQRADNRQVQELLTGKGQPLNCHAAPDTNTATTRFQSWLFASGALLVTT